MKLTPKSSATATPEKRERARFHTSPYRGAKKCARCGNPDVFVNFVAPREGVKCENSMFAGVSSAETSENGPLATFYMY